MRKAPDTIELKRRVLKVGEHEVDYVCCPEIGLYLCYTDTALTYRLVEPAIRFLMWINYHANVRLTQLDIELLRKKNVLLVGFELLEDYPDLTPVLVELDKYGMAGESSETQHMVFIPRVDERHDEVLFYSEILTAIRRDDPETKDR